MVIQWGLTLAIPTYTDTNVLCNSSLGKPKTVYTIVQPVRGK